MDFVGYDFLSDTKIENPDVKIRKLKRWHDRRFKKLKKPLEIKGPTPLKNNQGFVFKVVTAIGTYAGTGTITQDAIENALAAFKMALDNFFGDRTEKRQKRREKISSRKAKSSGRIKKIKNFFSVKKKKIA